MKNLYFFLLLLVSAAIWSCDNDGTEVNQVDKTVNEQNKDTLKSSVLGKTGTTDAGYRYTHHISNNGQKAKMGDQVTYHKVVYKNDTTLLQSTYLLLEPRSDILELPNADIKSPHPTYDALYLMSPGDSLTVYQTMDRFHVDSLPPKVSKDDRFSYNLKLLSIKPKAVIENEVRDIKARSISVADSLKNTIDNFKANRLNKKLITTESGLKYIVHKEGTGKKVKDGGFVKVHYLGMLENGNIFDETFSKAAAFPTRIGRGKVIAGWDEIIPLLNEGAEITLFVPYTLAYGKAGRPPVIPEETDLYFFISLEDVYFD